MNKLIFLFAFNSRLCITNFILILIRFAAIAKPPLRGDHKEKHKIKLIAINKEGQGRSQGMAPSKHQFDDFLLVRSRAALVINISDENRFSEKKGRQEFFGHFSPFSIINYAFRACFPTAFSLFLFYFYCGPPHFTLVSFLTPLFWGRNRYVRSVDEKWSSGTHAVFALRRFIALFTALTASSSTVTADGLDSGNVSKQNKSKSKLQERQIYPLPFLFLLDFFLGRTISIHFCILAPNIAALICLCRPIERVSSLECVVYVFYCGVVFTFLFED